MGPTGLAGARASVGILVRLRATAAPALNSNRGIVFPTPGSGAMWGASLGSLCMPPWHVLSPKVSLRVLLPRFVIAEAADKDAVSHVS